MVCVCKDVTEIKRTRIVAFYGNITNMLSMSQNILIYNYFAISVMYLSDIKILIKYKSRPKNYHETNLNPTK